MNINVRVIPRAKFNCVTDSPLGRGGGAADGVGCLKVHTTTAPTDGKANAAVIAALAKHFGVPKSNIQLLRGETSRDKVFEIT